MATTSITSATDGETSTQDIVRPVEDNEVAFFKENGWVLLRGLVPPEACHALLERGKPRFAGLMQGSDAKPVTPEERHGGMLVSEARGEGTVLDNDKWVEWRGPVRSAQDPVFGSVALAKTMGRNVQRLLGRDKRIRIYHDMFVCKLPDNISKPTDWHQDLVAFPLDRNVLTFWIALDEITPEQGPVQFYSGSHRCGLLGRTAPDRASDLLDEYPELARFSVSPPHHLQPGDCTVHHGLVVHGAGANNSPDPRWSYLVAFFPADARYTGAPNHDCDGFDLKVGYPIEHPSFTLVAE